MSNSPIIPFVVFGFIINTIVVLIVVIVIANKRGGKSKLNPHWQWLVDKLGLEVAGGEEMYPDKKFLSWMRKPLRLEGMYHKCFLKIYNYTVSSGKNSTTYSTARVVGPNPDELTLDIHREGMFSKLGKMMGMQDIQTGDEKFDKMFIVKCSDPDFIKIALLPQIKDKFYDVWETHKASGSIRLNGEELHYDEIGTIRNEKVRERFAAIADLLASMRATIEFHNQKAAANERLS